MSKRNRQHSPTAFLSLVKGYVHSRTLEATAVKDGIDSWKITIKDDPTVLEVWIPYGAYHIAASRNRELIPQQLPPDLTRKQILAIASDRNDEKGNLRKKGFVEFLDSIFFAVDHVIDWWEMDEAKRNQYIKRQERKMGIT